MCWRNLVAHVSFVSPTELDIGGDCSGANSANCKTGLVCDATGSTCSEFLCLFVFIFRMRRCVD